MSSLVIPLAESNRSTTALSFLIMTVITLFLSIIEFPDFSSVTVTFGLIFVTVLFTAILAAAGVLNWVKFGLCGFIPRFWTPNDFIGEDYKKIIQTPVFHRLVDNSTSNLLFGAALIVLSYLILLNGPEILTSFFGSVYELEPNFQIVFYFISIVVFISGLVIIFTALRKRTQIQRHFYDLHVLLRVRELPRTRQEFRKGVEKLLDRFSLFLKEKDFLTLHFELETSFLSEVEKQLIDYWKRLKEAESIIRSSKSPSGCYPFLTIAADTILQYPRLDSNFLGMFGSRCLSQQLRHPKYDDFPIFDVLFHTKSKTVKALKQVEKYVIQLQVIDSLIFRYTWYFLHAFGPERDSILKTISDVGLPNYSNESRLDNQEHIIYALLLSSCLLNDGSFNESNPITVHINYDGHNDKIYSNCKIEHLEKVANKAKLEFRQLAEQENYPPAFSGSNDKLNRNFETEIKFYRDSVKNRQWLTEYGIEDKDWIEIADLLQSGSFQDLFKKLRSMRELAFNFSQQYLPISLSELSSLVPKIPWRNNMIWLDSEAKFVLKKEVKT